jgi:quercetin dioxygenase-like cupin family protein
MNRRVLLDALVTAGIGTAFAPLLAILSAETSQDRQVLAQDLPQVTMNGWRMTALEVTYKPGEMDEAHRHPGFVFGYVIEGSLKFGVDGGTPRTVHAGEMFYEPPGSVHRLSGNASATQPARLLAMIFADKAAPLESPP